MNWVFKLRQPDDTARDPISGEFFATEAIKNSAEALIREGIQNSLDARVGADPVRVKVTISGEAWAAPAVAASEFLGGLAEHFSAPGNGLRHELRPDMRTPVQFLVYEDFGTSGLIGDPLQWHRKENVRNGFFAFFRAEGENAKSDDGRRGTWGIGKFVFPRSSFGSTFFGLTRRLGDSGSLLLGRCILKSHATRAGVHVPDGYFGEKKQIASGPITAPLEDPATLLRFSRLFRLTRTTEPGLSLVVPWYDAGISKATVVDAAVRDWFYCLLSGELEIEIVDPAGSLMLNSSSVTEFVDALPDEERLELAPVMSLAKLALRKRADDFFMCGEPELRNSVKWHDGMLYDEQRRAITAALDRNDPVGIRVAVTVRPKGRADLPSYFDVFLARDSDYKSGRPVFIREGIIVTDAKGATARGYRSLVVSTDKPISELLGDAENPAHTEWRADTGNFKAKYTYGKSYLDFVKESVRQLTRIIEANAENTAPDLLVDFFSLPEDSPDNSPQQTNPKPKGEGDAPEPPPVVPAPTPRRYNVTRVIGGFTVVSNPRAAAPAEMTVSVAYDVRSGDPFNRYDAEDFQLLKDIEAKESRGLKLKSYAANAIQFEVLDPNFHIRFEGFDTNRDVVVRVALTGVLADATTA